MLFYLTLLPRLKQLSYWLVLLALLAKVLSFTTLSWQIAAGGTMLILLVNNWRKAAVFWVWAGAVLAAYALPIPQPALFQPLLQLGLTIGIWSAAITTITVLARRIMGLIPFEQGQDNTGQDTGQNEGQS